MRIGIVINTSWNIYNFRSSLIKRLIQEGFKVIAIAPEDSFSSKLINLGCTYRPVKMDNTGANPLKDYRLYLELKRIYKSERLDIVLQFTIKPNIYGTLAASQTGIRCINNVSGLGTVFINRNLTTTIAKYLYRKSFQKATLTFFQNNDDRIEFIKFINIPSLNYDLLPGSGINLTQFQPSIKSKKKVFRFLMIARLIIDKGVLEYIEAAKTIKQSNKTVEFVLLGQIDEGHNRGIRREIIESASNEGIIKYEGTTDDVRDHIKHSDCVVLPSYREGTPRTLLEAAAMARPIITTNVPGCKEVVQDEINGLLCQSRSASDLSIQLQKMLSFDDKKRNKMGSAGRRLVEERYDEEIVINKYLKYIYQYSG